MFRLPVYGFDTGRPQGLSNVIAIMQRKAPESDPSCKQHVVRTVGSNAFPRLRKATAMKTNQSKTQRHSATFSRRKFVLTGGAAAAAFTIVPRHVLGGAGFVAPSEKIVLGYI